MTKSCPPPSTSKSAELSREEQARALCLRLLTARARTRAELAGQLTKRGYPDDVSTAGARSVGRRSGLVDDAGFAEQWVRSRRTNAGKGKRALAAELRTKGVDNDVITAALADIDAGAERERAEQLVRDKLRRESLGERRRPEGDAQAGRDVGAPRLRPKRWRSTWSRPSWRPSANAARCSHSPYGGRPANAELSCWRSLPGACVRDFSRRRERAPASLGHGSGGRRVHIVPPAPAANVPCVISGPT